jgi:hypothetical protein
VQWIASLLMIIGTSLGVYGAASAYFVPIAAPDAEIEGLTLNDNAGAKLDDAAQIVPVAKRGELLNAAMLKTLRENAAGIPGQVEPWQFVRVKEFAWSRWPGRWFTTVGTALLLVGAIMARRQRGAELEVPDDGSVIPITSESLGKLAGRIDDLLRGAHQSEATSGTLICDGTDELQKNWITPLLRAQKGLVARFGLGRAAEPLASLAGAERYLYRAWSASADGYPDEAIASLHTAKEHALATQAKLAALEGK